jgi:hypothetical protein
MGINLNEDDSAVRRGPDDLRVETLKVLGEQKTRYQSWTQDLPEVEISKELQHFLPNGEPRLKLHS